MNIETVRAPYFAMWQRDEETGKGYGVALGAIMKHNIGFGDRIIEKFKAKVLVGQPNFDGDCILSLGVPLTNENEIVTEGPFIHKPIDACDPIYQSPAFKRVMEVLSGCNMGLAV